MRVLMLAQFYPPVIGGEERMVEALSVGLALRGHEVAVATLSVEDAPAFEEREGVRIHRLPSTSARWAGPFRDPERRQSMPAPDPESTIALADVLRRERPDIVHAHNWLVHSFVPLKRRSGVGLVLSLHDFSLVCATKRWMHGGSACTGPGLAKCVRCATWHYGPVKGVPVALALRGMRPFTSAAVDVFAPVSSAVAEGTGLHRRGLPYDVLPNFLPDELLSPPADEPDVHGLPRDGFLLFVGDATYDKGTDLLLDAYGRLAGPPPLVLIGRALSGRLASPPPGVLVLGPRPHPEVLAAWRRCSIGIVPSLLPEAFGLAALEGQALGRPVIAAAHGGLVDVVSHEETGLLVPPGDAEALSCAIDRLLGDTQLRARLGDQARKRAERFTTTNVLPRVEALYARVRPPAAD